MTTQSMLKDLLSATELVSKVANLELTIEEFRKAYDNFYYAAALDGHENGYATQQILEQYKPVIQIHEAVQSIVDRLYLDARGREEAYKAAGRIDSAEAVQQLIALSKESMIEDLIRNLRTDLESLPEA